MSHTDNPEQSVEAASEGVDRGHSPFARRPNPPDRSATTTKHHDVGFARFLIRPHVASRRRCAEPGEQRGIGEIVIGRLRLHTQGGQQQQDRQCQNAVSRPPLAATDLLQFDNTRHDDDDYYIPERALLFTTFFNNLHDRMV